MNQSEGELTTWDHDMRETTARIEVPTLPNDHSSAANSTSTATYDTRQPFFVLIPT